MAKKSAKEEKIRIKLPKDKYHHNDVPVSINGKTTLIKRGITVEVSRQVYEVLEHAEEMEMKAYERSLKAQERYQNGESSLS